MEVAVMSSQSEFAKCQYYCHLHFHLSLSRVVGILSRHLVHVCIPQTSKLTS